MTRLYWLMGPDGLLAFMWQWNEENKLNTFWYCYILLQTKKMRSCFMML